MPVERNIDAVVSERVRCDFYKRDDPRVTKGTVTGKKSQKNCDTLLDVSVSSLRRGHANLLCIVPILADVPRKGPTIEMAITP